MTDHITDFLNYLRVEKGYSPLTLKTYEGHLRQLETFLSETDEGLDLLTLDEDVLRRWMVSMAERGLQARTVCKAMSCVRSFYKYLLMMGRIARDPAHALRNPKMGSSLPTFYRAEDMEHLFRDIAFPDNFTGLRDRTILLTFYHTGIRVSELTGLTLGSVRFSEIELKVLGKRAKERLIPLTTTLREQLRQYVQARQAIDGNALFCSETGAKLTNDKVRAIVKRYLTGIVTQKKRSPHVLRHTFATVMLNNGAELQAVKELLGHASLQATQIYTHATFAQLREQYAAAHPRQRDKQ